MTDTLFTGRSLHFCLFGIALGAATHCDRRHTKNSELIVRAGKRLAAPSVSRLLPHHGINRRRNTKKPPGAVGSRRERGPDRLGSPAVKEIEPVPRWAFSRLLLASAFKIGRLVGSLAEAKPALSMRKQSEPTATKCAPLHDASSFTNSTIAGALRFRLRPPAAQLTTRFLNEALKTNGSFLTFVGSLSSAMEEELRRGNSSNIVNSDSTSSAVEKFRRFSHTCQNGYAVGIAF